MMAQESSLSSKQINSRMLFLHIKFQPEIKSNDCNMEYTVKEKCL